MVCDVKSAANHTGGPFIPLAKSFLSLLSAFSLSVSFSSLLMIYIILGSYYLLIELLRYVNEFFLNKFGKFGVTISSDIISDKLLAVKLWKTSLQSQVKEAPQQTVLTIVNPSDS